MKLLEVNAPWTIVDWNLGHSPYLQGPLFLLLDYSSAYGLAQFDWVPGSGGCYKIEKLEGIWFGGCLDGHLLPVN